MLFKMKLNHVVRCETCGNQYSTNIERCPRCRSNQRTIAYGANVNRSPTLQRGWIKPALQGQDRHNHSPDPATDLEPMTGLPCPACPPTPQPTCWTQ